MFTILLIVLVILCIGGLPVVTTHSYGYAPSGVLGLVVVILLVFLLLGCI